MKPIEGANVWILGTTTSTLTDARGRFLLDSVAIGRQRVAFSSSGLDSVSLGDVTVDTDVAPGRTAEVAMASPSYARLWNVLCANRSNFGSDSGIVFGAVHDGESNARLAKAPVMLSWFNVAARDGLGVGEVGGSVATDSSGVYYACGLPVDAQLATEAYGNKAKSGEVQFRIGSRRILNLDLVVSSEMVQDVARKGSATVGGVVLDENREPVADAMVILTGVDSAARSGADGAFAFRNVPSGTHNMLVRKVGSANTSRIVRVRRGEEVQASVTLNRTTTLAAVNVGATHPKSMALTAFENRQKMGFGMSFDFTNDEPVTALTPLQTVPRVKISYPSRGGTPTITMTVDGGQRTCTADLYLDGRRTDAETIANYPPNLLSAMEVYNSPYQVPAEYMRTPVGPPKDAAWSGPARNGGTAGTAGGTGPAPSLRNSGSGACGVILYWTKGVLRPNGAQ